MTDDSTDDDGSDGTPSTRATDLSYEIDEDESPSEAVVRAVAAFTGTSILDLEPLYDTIDPDHLDGLFEDQAIEGGSITFDYCGCTVTVTSDSVRFREDGDGAD